MWHYFPTLPPPNTLLRMKWSRACSSRGFSHTFHWVIFPSRPIPFHCWQEAGCNNSLPSAGEASQTNALFSPCQLVLEQKKNKTLLPSPPLHALKSCNYSMQIRDSWRNQMQHQWAWLMFSSESASSPSALPRVFPLCVTQRPLAAARFSRMHQYTAENTQFPLSSFPSAEIYHRAHIFLQKQICRGRTSVEIWLGIVFIANKIAFCC